MKTILLVLAVLATLDACMSCSDPPNCTPRGGFCHPGNWGDCCCPDGCLGLIVGACYGTTRADSKINGAIHYSIFDANDKKLVQDTVTIDENSKASQEQVDRIVALYGNQTLYMDAHIEFFGDDANTPLLQNTWSRQKIN